MSDNTEDGTWVEIDCETETGAFAIITDVLPPEVAPKSYGAERPNRRSGLRKPIRHQQLTMIADRILRFAKPIRRPLERA